MLTYSQAQTVAYMQDGGFVCPDCARYDHGELFISRVDAGLERGDVHPISRYELDSYIDESWAEYCADAGDDMAAAAYEDAPPELCGDCGREL